MDQLRRLRKEKGLSQARLAARAEVDPSTVNQIERGAREASPSTLRKLADALDVSLVELLEADSPKAAAPSLPFEDQDERRRDVFYAIWLEYVDRWASHWEEKAERGELSRELFKEWSDSLELIGQTTGRFMEEESRDYPGENHLSEDKFVWKAASRALGTIKVVSPAAEEMFSESELAQFKRKRERIEREWSRAASG